MNNSQNKIFFCRIDHNDWPARATLLPFGGWLFLPILIFNK
jgi:hypothetical protein